MMYNKEWLEKRVLCSIENSQDGLYKDEEIIFHPYKDLIFQKDPTDGLFKSVWTLNIQSSFYSTRPTKKEMEILGSNFLDLTLDFIKKISRTNIKKEIFEWDKNLCMDPFYNVNFIDNNNDLCANVGWAPVFAKSSYVIAFCARAILKENVLNEEEKKQNTINLFNKFCVNFKYVINLYPEIDPRS